MSDSSEGVEHLRSVLNSHRNPALVSGLQANSASPEQLAEIRRELAGFRSELEEWRRKFDFIREGDFVPLEGAYLLNRAEHLVPDVLQQFSSMTTLADKPAPTRRNLQAVTGFLRWYRDA